MKGTSTLDRPAEAVIDPRIRARRIEVRRDEGRRRLSRLAEVGLVAGVALAFVAALFSPLLDVDEVAVAGTTAARAERVAEAAGIELGAPLISVDLRQAGRRVAALPWVAEVELTRRIDGAVHLAVTERRPSAAIEGPDGRLAVDVEGRVLGPVDGSASGLALLDGVAPVEPGRYLPVSTSAVLEVAGALQAALPGLFSTLEPGELVGTLAQGGLVRFGDAARIDAKIRSLTTVLAQVDLTCLAEIDLRLPGSPVLTREEGCS